jgi:hypothetical protein
MLILVNKEQRTMYSKSIRLMLVILLTVCVSLPGQSSQPMEQKVSIPNGNVPWVQNFTPLREFYVAPNGKGKGNDKNDPMDMDAAVKKGKPGDLFWVMGGTHTGRFILTKNGTAEHPIVFRSLPNAHVIINGGFIIKAEYNWIWGLEITDPSGIIGTAASEGIALFKPGIHLINNVIHHHLGNNGIGAWNYGAGQVVYGNIVYENGQHAGHPHNIYMQNKYSLYGYKYIVGNIFADSDSVCDNCFNVHGYGTHISGFHVERNIVINGRFLLGGSGEPSDRNVVTNNYFYLSTVKIGWSMPTQVEFTNNYLFRTKLETNHYWGAGEKTFDQTGPNVYTGNEFVLSSGKSGRVLFFRTATNNEARQLSLGTARIRPNDVFDYNKYTAPFNAEFNANNIQIDFANLAKWRNATAAAGNAFDRNSSEIPAPTGVKTVFLENEYDPNRFYVLIYNWDRRNQVILDMSSLLQVGSSFKIVGFKSIYGIPVISGTYLKPVTISTKGEEFLAYLLLRT